MAVQYAPTKLRVPPGFQNLLEGLAREVLREQPDDIIQFGAQYFKNQLAIREEIGKDDAKRGDQLEKLMKGEDVDIDLGDPEVQKAATKIQASFRGHKTREDIKHKKEEEEAATKIQANFRGHKAREEVTKLKETKSRESTEAGSPVKDVVSEETVEPKEDEKPKQEEEVDIDLNDPEVQGAALKIQASFRGHKVREERKKTKSGESLPANESGSAVESEAPVTEPAVATETEVAASEPEAAEAAATQQEVAKPADEVDIDLNDPEAQNAVIQEGQQQGEDAAQSAQATEDSVLEAEVPSQEAGEAPAAEAPQETAEEIDIDLDDPEVNKAATKIQASFRGHKTRKEMKDGGTPVGSQTSLTTPAEGVEDTADVAGDDSAAQEESAPADTAADAAPDAVADAAPEQETPAEEGQQQEAVPEGEAEGQQQEATPEGQQQEATPEGQQQEVTAEGQQQEATPEGQQQEATAEGQQQEAIPEGQQQEATAEGQQQEATAEGQQQEATPEAEAAPEGEAAEAESSEAPAAPAEGEQKTEEQATTDAASEPTQEES